MDGDLGLIILCVVTCYIGGRINRNNLSMGIIYLLKENEKNMFLEHVLYL